MGSTVYLLLVGVIDDSLARFYMGLSGRPRELWSALCSEFERATVKSRLSLQREFNLLRMKSKETVAEFCARIDQVYERIRQCGGFTEDTLKLAVFLSGLTGKFDSVLPLIEHANVRGEDVSFRQAVTICMDCELNRGVRVQERGAEVEDVHMVSRAGRGGAGRVEGPVRPRGAATEGGGPRRGRAASQDNREDHAQVPRLHRPSLLSLFAERWGRGARC